VADILLKKQYQVYLTFIINETNKSLIHQKKMDITRIYSGDIHLLFCFSFFHAKSKICLDKKFDFPTQSAIAAYAPN